MPRSRRRRAASSARQLADIGVAAPQVIAHRLGRLAQAGPVPSARDRREFVGMVVEKPLAFAQSWMAMCFESWRWQQRMALAFLSGPPSPARQLAVAQAALERIAARGLAPVRRKAVSNSRRLARQGRPRA